MRLPTKLGSRTAKLGHIARTLATTSSQSEAVADAIAATIAGLTPSTYAHRWDPAFAGIDRVPAGIVIPPLRIDAMANRAQIGSRDWQVEWPLLFYFDCARLPSAQARGMETIEAFIKAIDADHTLGGEVEIARVIGAATTDIDDEGTGRPLLEVEATVYTQWQEAI